MKNTKHIHCIGIGGIGLSALAQMLQEEGAIVTGCDSTSTPWLELLKNRGIGIFVPHDHRHLENIDLVIHTLALEKTNSELVAAREKGIPVKTYPQALGEVTKRLKTIAICGSHGKTTVTSMIAKIFIENEKDPNVIVGTQSFDLGKNNFRKGKGDWLILEACEYERAFLEYQPAAIVMTNLDHDHFDTYQTEESYKEAFYQFAKKLDPKNGILVGCFDDPKIVRLFELLQKEGFERKNLISYALENPIAQYQPNSAQFHLKIPGRHNLQNALAAFALASTLGIPSDDILYSLNCYEGSGRRLEEKGIIRNVRILDDYAHHPTEIRATLQALREKYPMERVWVVYQPHQFIRTKQLLNAFGPAFRLANRVIIPNIYDARDFNDAKKQVSVDELVAAIAKTYPEVSNGKNLEATAKFLKDNWGGFDLLLTMGAGDVWRIQEKLA